MRRRSSLIYKRTGRTSSVTLLLRAVSLKVFPTYEEPRRARAPSLASPPPSRLRSCYPHGRRARRVPCRWLKAAARGSSGPSAPHGRAAPSAEVPPAAQRSGTRPIAARATQRRQRERWLRERRERAQPAARLTCGRRIHSEAGHAGGGERRQLLRRALSNSTELPAVVTSAAAIL